MIYHRSHLYLRAAEALLGPSASASMVSFGSCAPVWRLHVRNAHLKERFVVSEQVDALVQAHLVFLRLFSVVKQRVPAWRTSISCWFLKHIVLLLVNTRRLVSHQAERHLKLIMTRLFRWTAEACVDPREIELEVRGWRSGQEVFDVGEDGLESCGCQIVSVAFRTDALIEHVLKIRGLF